MLSLKKQPNSFCTQNCECWNWNINLKHKIAKVTHVLRAHAKNVSPSQKQLLSAPIGYSPRKKIKHTYTFLGEMQRYNICHRANSKSIWRYFRIRRRYLYCMEVDKHLERFFVDEEYDEFAGSGNIAGI